MTAIARRRLELSVLLALGIAPFYLNGFYNAPLAANYRPWFWFVEIATWIMLPAVLLLAGRRRGLYTTEDLGLTTQVRGRSRPWALWLLLAAVPFLFWKLDVIVVQWAVAYVPRGWPSPPFRYTDVIPPPGPQTGWWRLLALCHMCMTAGIVEELYYRAAMDRLFPRGRVAAGGYVLTSSVVFAGAHWEGGLRNLTEAFILGVFAAVVFRLTRNLWPLILGHVVVDWYWFTGGAGGG